MRCDAYQYDGERALLASAQLCEASSPEHCKSEDTEYGPLPHGRWSCPATDHRRTEL